MRKARSVCVCYAAVQFRLNVVLLWVKRDFNFFLSLYIKSEMVKYDRSFIAKFQSQLNKTVNKSWRVQHESDDVYENQQIYFYVL